MVADSIMKVVFVNGCFDLLHAGHIYLLREACRHGDLLIVGLNSDASVRALKGTGHPHQDEHSRKQVLEALGMVHKVMIFDSLRCTSLIRKVRPDVYVTAEDYSQESLDSTEREALEDCGARTVFVPLLEGYSTTGIVRKIQCSIVT